VDHWAVDLGVSRAEIARQAGVNRVVLAWAFTTGKSPRAEEVRRDCLRAIRKLFHQ